jgi:hypothetical protein
MDEKSDNPFGVTPVTSQVFLKLMRDATNHAVAAGAGPKEIHGRRRAEYVAWLLYKEDCERDGVTPEVPPTEPPE